jgi:hypothetical protein
MAQPVGRPTVMTPQVLSKLEEGFLYAFSDEEACLFAGISPSSLYDYQRENPEFAERKVQLKLTPNLRAKRTVVDALGETEDAWKWLEKKDKDFKPTSKIEHAGKIQSEDVSISDPVKLALAEYNKIRHQQIVDEIKQMPE